MLRAFLQLIPRLFGAGGLDFDVDPLLPDAGTRLLD